MSNNQMPYFFGYKTEFFKNLDPSYKMYLDLFDSFGSIKLVL